VDEADIFTYLPHINNTLILAPQRVLQNRFIYFSQFNIRPTVPRETLPSLLPATLPLPSISFSPVPLFNCSSAHLLSLFPCSTAPLFTFPIYPPAGQFFFKKPEN
jgi:hypothetical protein